MLEGKRIWVSGHRGMVGQALMRRLDGVDCEVLSAGRDALDLRRQSDVEDWMADTKPELVFLAAATVGGIVANDTRPADFIYDNLAIQTNVIEAARRTGVDKLLFLSAACAYPREAPQPTPEESLLSGPLEPTNESSAVAKIAGIKMCEAYRRQYGCDFITAQPVNLFGPGDDFDPASAHVAAALMAKAHAATEKGLDALEVWGSGKPIREFLYVDDAADALVFLMEKYSDATPINVGPGTVLSIKDLAERIAAVVGFEGELAFDFSKPDGTPSKTLDASRFAKLGWRAATSFDDGLKKTYAWYVDNVAGAS